MTVLVAVFCVAEPNHIEQLQTHMSSIWIAALETMPGDPTLRHSGTSTELDFFNSNFNLICLLNTPNHILPVLTSSPLTRSSPHPHACVAALPRASKLTEFRGPGVVVR